MKEYCSDCFKITALGLSLCKAANYNISDYEIIKNLITANPILEYKDINENNFVKAAIDKVNEVIELLELPNFYIYDLYLPLEKSKFTSLYLVEDKGLFNKYNKKLNQLYIKDYNLDEKIFDSNKVLFYIQSNNNNNKVDLKPIVYLINDDGVDLNDYNNALYINISKISNQIPNFKNADEVEETSFAEEINSFYNSYNSTSLNIYTQNIHQDIRNIFNESNQIEIYGVKYINIAQAFTTYLSFFYSMIPKSYKSQNIVEYIYFPSVSSYINKDTNNIGSFDNNWIGGVLLAFKHHNTSTEINALRLLIQHVVSLTYQNYQILRLDIESKKVIIHAIRAAISQVMARNMSHNIGSHVLSKLITEPKVKEIFFKNKPTIRNLIAQNNNSKSFNDWDFYQCQNLVKDIDCKHNKVNIIDTKVTNELLIASFFDYLKARMDFLADITTSTPVLENTKSFYCDIIKPFIQNRILNDRISGVDTFQYRIIPCRPDKTKNDNIKCAAIISADHCMCTISENCDISVSIPNDVLGIQAIYTILENIIRNTTKHGKKPIINNDEIILEFKIKIEDASSIFGNGYNVNHKHHLGDLSQDDFYAVSIFDNCDLSLEISDISNWVREKRLKCCIAKGCNEIPRIQQLVIDQNEKLNESILKEYQLRQGGWGLIEMDASGAYLRKIPVEMIDSDEYEIVDLTGNIPETKGNKLCIYQAYAEQGKYLGYRFFIHKPREILIIGEKEELLSAYTDKPGILKVLKNNGILIKSTNEIKVSIENKIIFAHRLIVITDNDEELYKKIHNNPCFSKRILKLKKSVDINYDDLKSIWQKLYDDLDDNNKKYKRYNADEFAVDDHGKNYCTFRKRKFVEIPYSATKHFFNVTAEKELNMEYSWPLRIAVIDERIQYFAEHEKYAIEMPNDGICKAEKKDCLHESKVPYSELYKKTNILVPTLSDCDLNEQNFYEQGEPEYKKITKYIQNELFFKRDDEQTMPNCEFLVIHLGIIEKLIAAWNYAENSIKYDKEKQKDVKKFIKKVLLCSHFSKKLLKPYYDKIIVTSGRGKPHNLPTNIRYVNFSVISQYLITQRNKYAFTEALYSARKT